MSAAGRLLPRRESVTIARAPARCLTCEHAVGPDGDHFNVPKTRVILCRACPRGHHILSMSLPYPWTVFEPEHAPGHAIYPGTKGRGFVTWWYCRVPKCDWTAIRKGN